eukprot:Rmarinus@m.16345
MLKRSPSLTHCIVYSLSLTLLHVFGSVYILPKLSVWGITIIVLFGLYISACICFFSAALSDPGRVRSNEGPTRGYKWCETCQVSRPRRSKHCGTCGFCVRRFDHHCVWTASCVGEANHRPFIAFAVLQILDALLGLSLVVRYFWSTALRFGCIQCEFEMTEKRVASVVAAACLFGIIFLSILLYEQTRNLLDGLTFYERHCFERGRAGYEYVPYLRRHFMRQEWKSKLSSFLLGRSEMQDYELEDILGEMGFVDREGNRSLVDV